MTSLKQKEREKRKDLKYTGKIKTLTDSTGVGVAKKAEENQMSEQLQERSQHNPD
jgi:hypothetical protein